MSIKWEEEANAATEKQSCMTQERCSCWTLIVAVLMSKILVTVIELTNEVVWLAIQVLAISHFLVLRHVPQLQSILNRCQMSLIVMLCQKS